MKKVLVSVLCLIVFLIFARMISAQESDDVGVEEKLAQFVPDNLAFKDEQGNPVNFKSLITKPTILSFVYYRCPGICNPLLSGLVDVLDKVQLEPGKDFNVLTVSFDETDTYITGSEKKKNYMAGFSRNFPENSWKFLTGDKENITALTAATGFKFKKQGNDFLHTGVIIFLSPDGKIARYIYGITFLPFDVKMALTEAAEGRVGSTVSRVLLYCFSYDPDGRKYVFNITRVAGIGILFLLGMFLLYLTVLHKLLKKRKAPENTPNEPKLS